jgi:hypothetical protein
MPNRFLLRIQTNLCVPNRTPNHAMERTADRCTINFRDDYFISTPSNVRSHPPSLILVSLDLVQLVASNRNPLAFYFWGALCGWAASAVFAAVRHNSLLSTFVAGAFEVVLAVLYFRRSSYAWHAALLNVLGFGVYHLARGHQPHADIILGTLLIACLVVLYQPYMRYVAAHSIAERI